MHVSVKKSRAHDKSNIRTRGEMHVNRSSLRMKNDFDTMEVSPGEDRSRVWRVLLFAHENAVILIQRIERMNDALKE